MPNTDEVDDILVTELYQYAVNNSSTEARERGPWRQLQPALRVRLVASLRRRSVLEVPA
jgi:hypothetical protein